MRKTQRSFFCDLFKKLLSCTPTHFLIINKFIHTVRKSNFHTSSMSKSLIQLLNNFFCSKQFVISYFYFVTTMRNQLNFKTISAVQCKHQFKWNLTTNLFSATRFVIKSSTLICHTSHLYSTRSAYYCLFVCLLVPSPSTIVFRR